MVPYKRGNPLNRGPCVISVPARISSRGNTLEGRPSMDVRGRSPQDAGEFEEFKKIAKNALFKHIFQKRLTNNA